MSTPDRSAAQDLAAIVARARHETRAGDPFSLARQLQTPTWVFDIDNGHIRHANAAACHMWQAKDEAELQSRDMRADMSLTVSHRLRQYQADFIASDATFREMWTLYPAGKPTSVEVNFSGFALPDNRMAMLCEVVGETESSPDNIRSAEALLHTDVMIALYSLSGPPLYMNPAARNAVHDPKAPLVRWFVDETDHDIMMFGLENTGEHRHVVIVRTPNEDRWFDLSAKYCSDAATGEPAILLTAIDVSELKIARDKASYLADRDQLTGCFNRSYLQQHIARLTRFQSDQCALLYFDVDRFKQINDQFGHEAGDVVLVEITKRARQAIREGDVIVRLGGDEFVILLEGAPARDVLEKQINRFVELFSHPVVHDATQIPVSISIGVAMFRPSATDFTAVMRQADIALYASKQNGRNCTTFFDEEMGRAARRRDLIEIEIKRALERDEFVLHYQPRVDAQTGRIVSAEALVRWEHPDRGLVMPGEFIGICEETGMIEELGQQVLRKGCAQAIAWHQAGLDLQVSLNVSPRQFADAEFMQALATISHEAGFEERLIELEITENVLIGDHNGIANKLQKITEMGYKIAIDDFGTGYSNLSYISRFPLHCLKIDRSFIMQLPTSGPIVQLILALGRQIGATIVAEGVETQEQFNWLAAQQCNQMQGYFLAKPMPVAQIPDAVARFCATPSAPDG